MNLMRNGKMPTVTIEQAQKNFCKVCALVLKECLSILYTYCHCLPYLLCLNSWAELFMFSFAFGELVNCCVL